MVPRKKTQAAADQAMLYEVAMEKHQSPPEGGSAAAAAAAATATATCLISTRPASEYRQKVVRDLVWAIGQPTLLCASGSSANIVGSVGLTAKLLALSASWLHEIDAAPRPMLAWLSRRRRIARVLSYFSSLLEFWLTFCPFGMSRAQQPTTAEGTTLHKVRCKNCERIAAPGINQSGKPWQTCCRNCAHRTNRGPPHTAQCDFRKNSGIEMGPLAEGGMWSAEELVGKRSGVIKVPLRRVAEGQALGSHATRRSVKLGQLSLTTRIELPGNISILVHVEPTMLFAADVSSLLKKPPQGAGPKNAEEAMDIDPEPQRAPNLSTFVSADLDSNLGFRLALGQHVLAAAAAPEVQLWMGDNFPKNSTSAEQPQQPQPQPHLQPKPQPQPPSQQTEKAETQRLQEPPLSASATVERSSAFVAAGLLTIPYEIWHQRDTIPLPPELELGRERLGWWCASAQTLVNKRSKHARFAVPTT